MLRKASIVLSLFAALGLTAAPANAEQVHKNVHVNKTVHVNKNVHANYVVGRRYNGHIWYGQHRHRWHGTWYAYGVGPCWINVEGLWFWNVAACP